MYATVAAFLIRFTPVNTFDVHNWYESSGGKTTTLLVGASLVGNPNIDGLIQDANNTAVGIEKYLEFNSDTPVYWDETSNNKDFKDYLYMMGNGKGKGRGTKEQGNSQGGNWRTVIQSTGEFPLTKNDSTSTGSKMRLIEIHEALPRLEQEYLDELTITIKNNYGLFLDEIIQEIFKNKDHMASLYSNIRMFFEKANSPFSERAKSYFIVLALGGYILEEVLKAYGIQSKESIDICTAYYRKVVLEDPTLPYSERALQN